MPSLYDAVPSGPSRIFMCDARLLKLQRMAIETFTHGRLDFVDLRELVPGGHPGTWVWQEVAIH